MNAFWSVVARIGVALLSALPVERIVAMLLNKWLAKMEPGRIGAAAGAAEKAAKTARHLAELAELLAHIVEDRQLDASEVTQARESVLLARETLLALWADGRPAGDLQRELAKAGVDAAYAQKDGGAK